MLIPEVHRTCFVCDIQKCPRRIFKCARTAGKFCSHIPLIFLYHAISQYSILHDTAEVYTMYCCNNVLLVFDRHTSYSSSSNADSTLHIDLILHMMSLNPCTISQFSCNNYRYVLDIKSNKYTGVSLNTNF